MRPEIIAELKRIEKAHDGILRPTDVVAAAHNKRSAMHNRFEWDKDKASYAHWLEQARGLIREYTVAVTIIPKERVTYAVDVKVEPGKLVKAYEPRGYINLAHGGGYYPVEDVMSDPVKRAQHVQNAKRDAKAWRDRYNDIEEAADAIAEIEKFINQ